MKPKGKVKIEWSADFAYGIGLITTDGNLSKDGRHIHFTSKDLELVQLFKKCFLLENMIGKKARGGSTEKKYFVVQFGDVNFYHFLVSLGLTPAKSKTLASLDIPTNYFSDFLRGCIDGDGNIHISKHPESRLPQLRVRLCSASLPFLEWVKLQIKNNYGIVSGWIQRPASEKSIYELTYGKADSIVLLNKIYYSNVSCFLRRKFEIAKKIMGE